MCNRLSYPSGFTTAINLTTTSWYSNPPFQSPIQSRIPDCPDDIREQTATDYFCHSGKPKLKATSQLIYSNAIWNQRPQSSYSIQHCLSITPERLSRRNPATYEIKRQSNETLRCAVWPKLKTFETNATKMKEDQTKGSNPDNKLFQIQTLTQKACSNPYKTSLNSTGIVNPL